MPRRVFVWRDGQLIPKHLAAPRHGPKQEGPQVIRDLEPYKSMRTGEMIDGRRQHREHLRQHGMIEVGNETDLKHFRREEPMPSVAEDLKRAAERLGW